MGPTLTASWRITVAQGHNCPPVYNFLNWRSRPHAEWKETNLWQQRRFAEHTTTKGKFRIKQVKTLRCHHTPRLDGSLRSEGKQAHFAWPRLSDHRMLSSTSAHIPHYYCCVVNNSVFSVHANFSALTEHSV